MAKDLDAKAPMNFKELSSMKRTFFPDEAPIAIYEIELSPLKFRWVNEYACATLGYTEQELLAKDIKDLLAESSQKIFHENITKALNGKKTYFSTEVEVKTKDGSTLWGLFNSRVIFKENTPASVIVFAQNITEHKKADEALRLSREKYAKAFLNSPFAVTLTRFSDGVLIEANNSATKLFGYSFEEVIGKESTMFWENLIDRPKFMTELSSKGWIQDKEIAFRKKDGSRLLVSLSGSIIMIQGEKYVLSTFIDISECRKAEKELAESEQLYRMLFDNSQDGFMLLEPIFDNKGEAHDFRFLKINKAYENQTGAKAEDVLGKRASEVIPELESEIASISANVVKYKKSCHNEAYNRYSKKWYDSYYFPYATNKVGILFRDVSERKLIEQKLSEKQKELSQILDSTPTIVFHKDKQGKFLEVNRAFAEALDTSKADLLGKTVFDLYSPKIAQSMTNDDQIVMKTKQPKLGIIEPYEATNGIGWIRTHKIPSFDDKGEVAGLIGFSEDITERKKAEDALKESEAKYEQLVNRLPEMVFEINTLGKIVFANSRAIEILGYLKDELVNSETTKLVADEDKARSKANMKTLFSGKIRHSNEYTFVRKDGTQLQVLLNSVPIIKDNKVVGARSLVIDITERKNMEKRLQDSERLAAIGQTAGMVGHDIRNPLQAIMGDVYLLKDYLLSMPDSSLSKDISESLHEIEQNIGYINKIVADLQDYSRAIIPTYSNSNLSALITGILNPITIPDNISLSIDIDKTLRITTDTTLFTRIVTNLITNALQAMPNGGVLSITSLKNKSTTFLSIGDTGVGIPDHVKPKLFTPMVTTKSKGQGLGLAVVKRLVEALNGTVSFESKEGNGAKFTIMLPNEKI